MARAIRRFSVLWGVALCAVLVGPVAIAQATDDTLRGTLNTFAPRIVNDEHGIKNGLKQYSVGHWKVMTRALKREVSDLRALKGKLVPERASTARGAKAKKKIVRGLVLIADAYAALRRDIFAVHGNTVPLSVVTAAIAERNKGNEKLTAGLKLLR